jgi:hypothetical protein
MTQRLTSGLSSDHAAYVEMVGPEAVTFGLAMERYQRLHDRPYPDWAEVLSVLRSLGYRKTEAPTELPVPPKMPLDRAREADH